MKKLFIVTHNKIGEWESTVDTEIKAISRQDAANIFVNDKNNRYEVLVDVKEAV